MKRFFKVLVPIKNRYYIAIFAVIILTGIGSWCWYSLQPKRVHRKHTKTVSKQFEYLTRKIDFSFSGDTQFSKKEAKNDLDELEWLLENRFSYLRRKEVDYRSALDTIRSSFGDGIGRGMFALQMRKFLALFGDGHSGVGSCSFKRMYSDFLPFLIGQSGEQLVAFKADRSGFLDARHPFLNKIDGIELENWIKVASQTEAEGSAQFLRHRSIRNLRYIQHLRKELRLTVSDLVEVELQSADGSSTKQIKLSLSEKPPVYGLWPRLENEFDSIKDIRAESRIIEENIGYLRIPFMLAEPNFLSDITNAMNDLRETKGLIIDIRSNGGGSRAPLRVLFPYFMDENDPPKILNVAAYRLGHRKDILDARWLYPENHEGWSSAQRAAVKQIAQTFQPEWTLPANEFSDWHYFIIAASDNPEHYHYDRPVIVLMDTGNFSASDIFLGAFKGWRNITLMGTPSGGGSGRRRSYRLHHSKIQISLSSMASFQPNGKLYEVNGIEPDIMIEPIPTDFIGETDTILEAAIQKLR